MSLLKGQRSEEKLSSKSLRVILISLRSHCHSRLLFYQCPSDSWQFCLVCKQKNRTPDGTEIWLKSCATQILNPSLNPFNSRTNSNNPHIKPISFTSMMTSVWQKLTGKWIANGIKVIYCFDQNAGVTDFPIAVKLFTRHLNPKQ